MSLYVVLLSLSHVVNNLLFFYGMYILLHVNRGKELILTIIYIYFFERIKLSFLAMKKNYSDVNIEFGNGAVFIM